MSDTAKLTDPELDTAIDHYAKVIATTMDTAGAVRLAAMLDTLMRYREDRETREHRARMAGPVRR